MFLEYHLGIHPNNDPAATATLGAPGLQEQHRQECSLGSQVNAFYFHLR